MASQTYMYQGDTTGRCHLYRRLSLKDPQYRVSQNSLYLAIIFPSRHTFHKIKVCILRDQLTKLYLQRQNKILKISLFSLVLANFLKSTSLNYTPRNFNLIKLPQYTDTGPGKKEKNRILTSYSFYFNYIMLVDFFHFSSSFNNS